jgi:hypothetical protein
MGIKRKKKRMIKGNFFALLATITFFLFTGTSVLSFGREQNSKIFYVGSLACKKCHPDEYANFITYAKKSTSFQSIEKQMKHLAPDEIKNCYTCHTTGYGKPGGFVSLDETPHLKNAGCEVCHGPGAEHIKSGDPATITSNLSKKDCEVCHISERVKAFKYKPLIHGGAH